MKPNKPYVRAGAFLLFISCLVCCRVVAQQKKPAQQRQNMRSLSVAESRIAENATGVSVTDFGAAGDGLTDDTYAVQQAINSGAGAVYFPTTVHGYRLGTVFVNNTVTIYGDNKQTTLITPISSNKAIFVFTKTFITIKNLYFVCFAHGTVNDTAIALHSSVNTIDNCFFSGFGVGIFNDSRYPGDEQYIKNCRFRDCGYGILSDGYFRNTRISDYCIFHTCNCAIRLYDNNDYIHTTEGVVLENSMIYDCGDSATKQAAVELENVDFTFIRNCMIDLNHYNALSVKESKWCDFSGTYFSSNHSGNASAVRILGDCSDLFIHNCRFFDSRSWGLELQGQKRNAANITLSDCSFRLNPAGDIIVNGVANVRISKSNFYTDVPTSIAAISNDGPASVSVSESMITGGVYKGNNEARLTLKDCPNQPTLKTGTLPFVTGQNKISFAHGLLVLPGQSVVVTLTGSSASGPVAAVVSGKDIIVNRENAAGNGSITYRAEVF